MKLGRKRALPVLLCALLLTLVIPGCSREEGGSPEKTTAAAAETTLPDVDSEGNYESPVLRVLTEEISPYSVEDKQLDLLVKEFEKAHANTEVEIISLPRNYRDRGAFLEEVVQEIEQGAGPDVFMLTASADNDDSLFSVVNQAMRSGVFLDLSEYYDMDQELNTQDLNETVMEAGVVDGVRYTLPLKYSMPVLYYVPELAENLGLPADLLVSDAQRLLDNLIWWDNPDLVKAMPITLGYQTLAFFPEVVDYDSGEVLISAENITDWLECAFRFDAFQNDSLWDKGFVDYTCGRHWTELDQCVSVADIGFAVENAAICKATDLELQMMPLTGPGGKVVAEVTKYGAINAKTAYPELAYQFLRQYLMEDTQWMKNVTASVFSDSQNDGYCVRTVNSVENLLPVMWEVSNAVAYFYIDTDGVLYKLPDSELERRDMRIRTMKLADADVPVLQVPIDVARFPVGDFSRKLGEAFFGAKTEGSTEMPDYGPVAEQFIRDLQAYMQERP